MLFDKVTEQYAFHYLMKSVTIPGNQSSIEILQSFDTWCYQHCTKMKFSIKDFFIKCDQICRNCGFCITFTEEILNGKLHFLCNAKFNNNIFSPVVTVVSFFKHKQFKNFSLLFRYNMAQARKHIVNRFGQILKPNHLNLKPRTKYVVGCL